MAVKNRFAGFKLNNRAPEELWQEVRNIVNEEMERIIPMITTETKGSWISENKLKIARKRYEVKINGNKQLYSKLNAEFQWETRKGMKKQIQQECEKAEEYNKEGKTRGLFKKIRDSQDQFVARNGTLLEKQLSNADEIKNRWKEYDEELYKRDFNMTGTLEYNEHETEPDILESEVRLAIEALENGKAAGHSDISIELLKVLKQDTTKVLTIVCQQIWKTKEWPLDWQNLY